MSKGQYEDAFGVLALEWERGEPPKYDHQPVICEVWYADLQIADFLDQTGQRPAVRVQSRIEFRVWTKENGWRVIGWSGELHDPKAMTAIHGGQGGVVRRFARPTMRYAHINITLDKWGKS